ncbi:hypothetical protein FQR65_LT12911 [Abscondita terminalis]|nr:hypothetical protein FQR65_LT12911 [Abscondita terminalis]
MASDEETPVTTSKVSILISKAQKMLKHPQLNGDLSQALDAFMKELNVNNHYLRNGIFTMKFAEFGIFLQVTVELYGKQVDLLWEDTLHYHVKLCSYNQLSNQNALEAEVITERINRNKRKKIIRQIVQNSVLSQNLLEDLEKSTKLLQASETMFKSDTLKNLWKDVNKNDYFNAFSSSRTITRKSSTPSTNFQFSSNQNVQTVDGEKLGNYHDLFLTHITSCLESINETTEVNILRENNKDYLLQRYLKHKGISYKKFCLNKLGTEFNFFKRRIRQIDALLPIEAMRVGISNASISIITPLPEQLLTESGNDDDDDHLRAIIHDILLKERLNFGSRIKKSERISEADSAFNDENFIDSTEGLNTPMYNSQQSNVDSGIFSDLQEPTTPSVSNFGCCASENNVSSCINGTLESDFEEILNAADIPQNSMLNSTSVSGMDEHATEYVHSSFDDTAMDCSFGDINLQETLRSGTETAQSIATSTAASILPSPSKSSIIAQDFSTNARAIPPLAAVGITTFTTIKPIIEKREAKAKAQKRQNLRCDDDYDDDEPPVKLKRKVKFKWLKTTTTTLKKFERFYYQNYVPEDDEVDPNRCMHYEDDSEDETNISIGVENCVLGQELFEVFVLEEMCNDVNNEVEVPDNHVICDSITHPINTELEQSGTMLSTRPTTPPPNLNEQTAIGFVEIQTTNRIRAVNEWRNFIEPKLKRMEKSSEFDIHEYGSKIMDRIPEGENLEFRVLVSGKKSSEVCKLFLASLQLANTGNIEVISPEQGKLSNNSLEFKLLTRERYHEYLDEYEAPSENTFRERLERVKAIYPEVATSTPKVLNRNSRSRLRFS